METKDLSEMRLSSARVSEEEEKAEGSILSTHLPGGTAAFAPVLNNPIRDGLRRVIGCNFVSNIRFRLHQ